MRVHLNFDIRSGSDECIWSAEGGRKLLLINKAGQVGNVLDNINLGYFRNGRISYIFLNNPIKAVSTKTVGIFCWPDSFTTDRGARYLGVTKNDGEIQGMYGIFDLGTIIYTREGSEWELTTEGWIQNHVG